MAYTSHHEYVEAVRTANPILELATEFFGAPASGTSWVCSFHSDTQPSFHVSPQRGTFKCFGCQIHGDVFTLVEIKEGLGFSDALDFLAKRSALPTYRAMPADRDAANRERDIELITERAADYYHTQMAASPDSRGMEYFLKRHLPPSFISEHTIGWADGGLCTWVEETYGVEWLPILEAAGLATALKNQTALHASTHRDRFFDRVMFPSMRRGRVVFMSGRAVDAEAEPKYLHQRGREAPLYPNDDNLPLDRVYLVEGPIDALSLRAWGYPAYALQGGMRASAIRKLTPVRSIYGVFDADQAGRRSALKLAESLGVQRVKLVALPEGQDPNDLRRAGQRSAFGEAVTKAYDPIAFALLKVPDLLQTPESFQEVLSLLATTPPEYAEAKLETHLRIRYKLPREVVTACRETLQRYRDRSWQQCPACGTILNHSRH